MSVHPIETHLSHSSWNGSMALKGCIAVQMLNDRESVAASWPRIYVLNLVQWHIGTVPVDSNDE